MKRERMVLAVDDDSTRQRCVSALRAASLKNCVDAPYASTAFHIAFSPELFQMKNQGAAAIRVLRCCHCQALSL